MTLRHLEIFICVYKNSSISKAAKELHISQPSVSIAIKELETEYHTKLFDRMNRKIYPTEAAHKFFQYASHIQHSLYEMEDSMKSYNETNVSIGCSFAISQFIMPVLLTKFQSVYPKIKFHIIVDNSNKIERRLLNNAIDFALLETDPDSQDVIKIPFFKDNLETICSIEHPLTKYNKVTLQDILQFPYYTREEGSSVSSLVKSVFYSHQLALHPVIESANPTSLIEFVNKSLGITTLPHAMIEQSVKNNQVVVLNVEELHIQRTYHIIYHKNKYIPDVYQHLFEICSNYQEV